MRKLYVLTKVQPNPCRLIGELTEKKGKYSFRYTIKKDIVEFYLKIKEFPDIDKIYDDSEVRPFIDRMISYEENIGEKHNEWYILKNCYDIKNKIFFEEEIPENTIIYNRTKSVGKIPASVINAMKDTFNENLSYSDLISAFVYLHTFRKAELYDISKTALKAVKEPLKTDPRAKSLERINSLTYNLVASLRLKKSIETGVANILADRLYTLELAKKPCEQNLLSDEMLITLKKMREEGDINGK